MTQDTKPDTGSSMARRLLGFAGLPFLSMATPFLFLPILARVAGADAWVAVAVGQSTGAFFALIVAQGYNLVGPTMVSLLPDAGRPAAFRRSVQSRLVLFIPSALAACAIAWFVSPEGFRGVGALMSLAMTFTGLSSSWYMIGLGKAGLIALFEIAPKMVATGIAALIVITTAQVIWYPVLLIIGSCFSLVTFSLRTVSPFDLLRFRPKEIQDTLRKNRTALATEVAGGAYVSLTVTFVSATTVPSQAASYVSGDKLYKLGQYAVSAVGNALQGWVVERGGATFAHRIRQSLIIHSVLGGFGLLTFALIGPPLSAFLFGDVVAMDQNTALGFGAATLAISLNTSLGRHILVGLGLNRQMMVSVFVGAGVGVPTILVLSALYGAPGGAWGLACSEVVVALVQAVFVYLHRSKIANFEASHDQMATR